MNVLPASLPDVLIIEPHVFEDARGFFFESYNAREFARQTGIDTGFVQDNHSRSARNVLRGLHYQLKHPQGKLVRVTTGQVFDVVVDLRRSSPCFGRWSGNVLSADNKRMLWIPPGFAHGFLVTSEYADFLYKTDAYRDAADERCVAWNDPQLNISWPLQGAARLSDKDRRGVAFAEAEAFA
jgi:dTDP-4-dehydrorhamnose 3,5-epimerase